MVTKLHAAAVGVETVRKRASSKDAPVGIKAAVKRLPSPRNTGGAFCVRGHVMYRLLPLANLSAHLLSLMLF